MAPESRAPVQGQDLRSASSVLEMCIGKDGNFTVVVEENLPDSAGCKNSAEDVASTAEGSETASESAQSTASEEMPSTGQDGDELKVKRTEIKVWASLLSHWSPVFKSWLSSDSCMESKNGQVVIQDFSPDAVKTFLRFLYSGTIEGSPAMLVEVAAMADRYQVSKLHELCVQTVTQTIPEVACEVFAAADHFFVAALRMKALEFIFIHPAEALKCRPKLSRKLLEEILLSGLLCMEDAELAKMLRGWGKDESDGLQPFIDFQIQRATVRKPGEHSKNVLGTLWSRYNQDGRKGTFVGEWVLVTLGREQGSEEPGGPAKWLMNFARSMVGNKSLGPGWMRWDLIHSHVHVMGFSFIAKIPGSVSFQILCSEDGTDWHSAYVSEGQDIPTNKVLPCQFSGLAKCFKLQVLDGEIDIQVICELRIHGILQAD
ncbi:bath-42 [Symbiodinium sp. CCMP2592]|nr:bath-42 [Symbiodinium sp. CCMP2592]